MRKKILLAVAGLTLSLGVILGSGVAQATTYQQMYQSGNTAHCMYTGNMNEDNPVSFVTCSGGPLNTEWTWTSVGTNEYEIVNHNGKCLTDPDRGGQGTTVVTATCNTNINDYWEPSPVTAGSSYDQWVNLGAGQCLDGGSDEIRIWNCNQSAVQGWVGP